MNIEKLTEILEKHIAEKRKLIKAGEALFLRMDYFMGDTDPQDETDPNLIACQQWRYIVREITGN